MKRELLILSLFFVMACGPKIDLAKAVVPESVTTGWANGGVVAGKSKIVPAVSFRLKNVSNQKLGPLQVNAVFRRVNDPAEWSSGYLPNVATELPPGGVTDTYIVVGQQGYTSTDDREAMLRNRQFVDAKVELYVKAGSSNWTRIGEYPIARQMLDVSSH